MPIDYTAEAGKYRPSRITTLLVGEAPPASGTAYFYVPRELSTALPIENDRGLPATIFLHYFGRRPTSINEYIDLLLALKANGIFLVDICDEPIRVRGSSEGICRIISKISRLREKFGSKGIIVPDTSIVFLLARRNYKSAIRCVGELGDERARRGSVFIEEVGDNWGAVPTEWCAVFGLTVTFALLDYSDNRNASFFCGPGRWVCRNE